MHKIFPKKLDKWDSLRYNKIAFVPIGADFVMRKKQRRCIHASDISTFQTVQKEGAWLQKENEHG